MRPSKSSVAVGRSRIVISLASNSSVNSSLPARLTIRRRRPIRRRHSEGAIVSRTFSLKFNNMFIHMLADSDDCEIHPFEVEGMHPYSYEAFTEVESYKKSRGRSSSRGKSSKKSSKKSASRSSSRGKSSKKSSKKSVQSRKSRSRSPSRKSRSPSRSRKSRSPSRSRSKSKRVTKPRRPK